jgi:hypothetical protein
MSDRATVARDVAVVPSARLPPEPEGILVAPPLGEARWGAGPASTARHALDLPCGALAGVLAGVRESAGPVLRRAGRYVCVTFNLRSRDKRARIAKNERLPEDGQA